MIEHASTRHCGTVCFWLSPSSPKTDLGLILAHHACCRTRICPLRESMRCCWTCGPTTCNLTKRPNDTLFVESVETSFQSRAERIFTGSIRCAHLVNAACTREQRACSAASSSVHLPRINTPSLVPDARQVQNIYVQAANGMGQDIDSMRAKGSPSQTASNERQTIHSIHHHPLLIFRTFISHK